MSEEGRFKAAKKRYPEHFKITEEVIGRLHEWIDRSDIPAPQTFLEAVKLASVVRAFNLYRSVNLLLKHDHWEDAAILSRSLFELLLNLEEVTRDNKTAEEKARTYFRFQVLQNYLQRASVAEYEAQKGRAPDKQTSKQEAMREMARSVFAEFLRKGEKSEWVRSWCRKNVHDLASDSSNRMRAAQYKLLYSLFSDISHSSPYSTQITMSLGFAPEQTEMLFQRQEDYEREHMALVLSVSTTWLLEILAMARAVIPSYDIKWNFKVLSEIFRIFGVEPPKLAEFIGP